MHKQKLLYMIILYQFSGIIGLQAIAFSMDIFIIAIDILVFWTVLD